MQAQLIRAFGEPEVFQLETVTRPEAGPGQVLVRQRATSVNPVDYKIRRHGPALGPVLPAVLGADVAGEVVAVGAGVTAFKVGDEVYGSAGGVRGLPGAYAEYVNADARLLAAKPKTLSWRETAALPLVSITAWEGLVDRARIQPGEKVLVLGGAGGVGHIAVQIAKARGAHVTATVSSATKAALVRELGADAVVNYREETVADYVQRLTDGAGFDVVFDAVGGDNLNTALQAARLNGQVVTIVASQQYDLTPMHLKGLSLHVVFMLIPMLHDPKHRLDRAHHGQILREVAKLADAGQLRPVLDSAAFALADMAAAHRRLESGAAVGKVVVEIG
ncbi:zinc-dependent alcohol dehydrogenase family protein [Permianibacter sp. IMCC34836]|nr:zinc-dependent alcohol dehydrogenase family protein [Permianibacter fluminis]